MASSDWHASLGFTARLSAVTKMQVPCSLSNDTPGTLVKALVPSQVKAGHSALAGTL